MLLNIGRIIVIVQALLGVINSYLIIKAFGIGNNSDALLLSIAMMFSFYLFFVMPFEQFIFYFHKEKIKGNEDKYITYQYIVSVIICIIGCLTFYFSKGYIISLYTNDKELSIKILNIIDFLLIGYSIYPICYVLEKHTSSIGKVNCSIFLELIPNLGLTIGLLVSIYYNFHELSMVCITRSLFLFIEFFIGLYFIRGTKLKFDYKYSKGQWITSSLYSNKVKIIKTLPTIVIEILISRVLTTYGQGYISIYYYANRFAVILKQIVVGPSFRIYQNSISKYIATGIMHNIFDNMIKYIKESLLLYLLSAIILYYLIPKIFLFFVIGSITIADIDKIQDFFVVLAFSQILIIIENSISFIAFSMEKIKLMTISYCMSTLIFIISLVFTHTFLSLNPIFIIGLSLVLFYFVMVSINIKGIYHEKNNIL
ncbi:TPA: hypothetical protein ACX6PU_003739 [Photobacterium damselae]